MVRKHYNLPPLTTLAAFEAAARRLSFKDAALELNVTPGAVSHQIKALEGELAVSLFERQHRVVVLTEHGAQLYAVLERSFSAISATVGRLRQARDRNIVTVAATTAVSSLWLTPRLLRFWREGGTILVNQNLSDLPAVRGDFAELRILYGNTSDSDLASFELFRDRLIPVCGPGFADKNREPSLDELARMPLIHIQGHPNWTTWNTWFRELGYLGEVEKGTRVNNYIIALQAACEGAGVVLGWQRLVRPHLERGELVTLGSHALPAPDCFHIISQPEQTISESARILRDWLLDHK